VHSSVGHIGHSVVSFIGSGDHKPDRYTGEVGKAPPSSTQRPSGDLRGSVAELDRPKRVHAGTNSRKQHRSSCCPVVYLEALSVSETPNQRALRARMAAHEKWARTTDRTGETAPARAAFLDRFDREVDPEGVLAPAERARRAEHARKAYFTRLAYKSSQKRQQPRTRQSDSPDLRGH